MKALSCAAVILLLLGPLGVAKTKMLVEDPNNVVVGRYAISAEQRGRAEQMAATLLSTAKQQDLQKALVLRYVAVDAGPLTAEQQRREPGSIRNAEKRFARYGVAMDPDRPLYTIALYDTVKRRILHNRIYTVTELPGRNQVGRFDDYHAMYLEGFASNGYRR